MADYIGQQIGNYRLVNLLGEGGFAEVYLGEHIHLGTQAAVKVLTTKLTGEGITLFREEARIIISLEHPNIVRVHDFGIQDRIPYIVMNYAPNGSLRRLHPRGTRLSLEGIVSYVKQIAAALQYAHEQKLIHRDVKPDNMLLGQNNTVLLSDFGIAVVAHSTRSLNTQDKSGTLYYMAPEQIQGKPRIASDQYALGIVVYEWLNGRPPFIGTAAEIGMKHLLTPPPSLDKNIPPIPYAVEQVVMRALDKDPKQRFENVQAFAIALEQASQPLWSASSIIPEDQAPLLDDKVTPSSQLRMLSVSTNLTHSSHQHELTPIVDIQTDSPDQLAIPTDSLNILNQLSSPTGNEALFVKQNQSPHSFNVPLSPNQPWKNPDLVKMTDIPKPQFSLFKSLKYLQRMRLANVANIPLTTPFVHSKSKPSVLESQPVRRSRSVGILSGLIILVLVVLLAGGGFLLYSSHQSNNNSISLTQTASAGKLLTSTMATNITATATKTQQNGLYIAGTYNGAMTDQTKQQSSQITVLLVQTQGNGTLSGTFTFRSPNQATYPLTGTVDLQGNFSITVQQPNGQIPLYFHGQVQQSQQDVFLKGNFCNSATNSCNPDTGFFTVGPKF